MPFRILMFASYLPPEYSGAAAQAFLLAERLRARGHRIEFVTQSGSGVPREYEVAGFPVTALRNRRQVRHPEFSVWRNLLGHLWRRRRSIDILHGHGAYYTQSALGPIGRLLGKPTLLKASMSENDLSSLSRSTIAPIHRRFLRLVDAYVAISADLKAEFAAKGLPAARVWHIPNGVDTGRFQPADAATRATLRTALELPAGRRIALYVGVFDARKRVAWLLEQWVANRGFGTGALLLAVGPTSREPYGRALREQLAALATAHPDLVMIRDYSAAIEHYYRAADLLVFPSVQEGLPNAVLEAMACGLPCVAARACGSRELVRDDINGATFAIDDADQLAAALARVQGAAALRMGATGRAIACDEFGIERVTDQYEALYRQLMAGRGRSGRGDYAD